jgi:pimeloyl-ACP methyl ester carboxylesterase
MNATMANPQTVSVQGASVFVLEQGAGRPTLFLHGNPDSADMWMEVIAGLNGRYRSFAPDLPGYGRSAPRPDFKIALEDEAQWVDELINALAVAEPLNLVMHDFGAHFGLAWAIRHLDRVRRIVIFNTSFFSDYRWHPLARVLRTPLLGELGLAAFNEARYLQQLAQDAPDVPRAYVHRAMALYTPAAKAMTLRLYRGTNPRNFVGWEDELPALTARVPTLVMWGDQDPYAPRAWAERFGAREVQHFAENSHWVPLEAPQVVARRLSEFLS